MSFSDLRERVHIMRLNGFKKTKGGPYIKTYEYAGFQKQFAMSVEEVIQHINLDGFMRWNRQQFMSEIKTMTKGMHSKRRG